MVNIKQFRNLFLSLAFVHYASAELWFRFNANELNALKNARVHHNFNL